MSENYLQTSFAFDLTTSEAAHLATALAIIALLDDADQTPALTAWNDAPQDFNPHSSDSKSALGGRSLLGRQDNLSASRPEADRRGFPALRLRLQDG